METTSSPTLIERFGWLMQILYEAVAYEARRKGVGAALQTAISWRLIGLWQRLRRALVRWEAGTLCPPRPRARRVAVARAEGAPAVRRLGEQQRYWVGLIPGRFGWLRQLLGPRTAGAGVGFLETLEGPEMQAVLAAAPQVARILRPFYHFLGLPLPAALALPRRQRARKPREALPPHPSAARLPDTPAGRSAARYLARVQAGLPADPDRLSSKAYDYVIRPRLHDESGLPFWMRRFSKNDG